MAVKFLKLLGGLAVGALLLVFTFRGMAGGEKGSGFSWDDIAASIRGTAWWALLASVLLFVVQVMVRTERWRIQVRGLVGRAPPIRESLAINAAGMAGVFLLPFRLGEFVRPNLSAQRGIMRASAGLAGTALERVIDGIVTTGFFGGVILVMHRRGVELPDEVAVGGWLALSVFSSAIVFFLIAFRWRDQTTRLVERGLGVVHGALARKVGSILRGFLDGLACFRRPGDLFFYVALTVLFWVLNAVSIYVLALGMDVALDGLGAVFCMCFLVIGMMVPAPPGNVGNFHAFARVALGVSGVPAAPAVAFAIVLHAITAGSVVCWAAAFFVSGDLSLERVRAAARSGGEEAGGAGARGGSDGAGVSPAP